MTQRRSQWWIHVLAILPLACVAKPSVPPEAGPAEEGEEAATLDLEGARQMVPDIELANVDDDSACAPKTYEDVESVLKLDQASLFGPATRCAKKLEGVQAEALEAQLELAWGESYLTLLEIMLYLGESYDERGMELVGKEQLTSDEQKELEWLREERARTERFADAFTLLSIDHATKGAALANQVIEKYPDNYLGYRVAADYHRMDRNWKEFDRMIAKIEELNADSNGLVFQRGAAAWQRDGNREEAEKFLRRAIERDPEFVRAQAHLVAIQEDAAGLHAELATLEAMNPDHQIVEWAKKGIDWLYARKVQTAPAAEAAP